MPDITVVIGVHHTVEDFFHGIELVWAKHHQAFVSLMKHDVFANHLAQRAFIKKECGKFVKFVKRHISCIRPVERELITAIRIIGKITGVHTIGYDK